MEPYLGEIRMFAGSYPPSGWALCDGQLLTIAANSALFSLIGTTYGGDGQTTFQVPDLRGRLATHQGRRPGSSTPYMLGQRLGVEHVTLMPSEMPAHTHRAVASSENAQSGSPANHYWAGGAPYSDAPPDGEMAAQAIGATGGSTAHDNMAPYLVISYIISLYGIYPVRP